MPFALGWCSLEFTRIGRKVFSSSFLKAKIRQQVTKYEFHEGRPNIKEQMLGVSASKSENSSSDVEEFVISLNLLPYIVDF